MKNLFAVAAIVSFGLTFATSANATVSPPVGVNSGTIAFATGKCKLGYVWDKKEQKCTKAERDY